MNCQMCKVVVISSRCVLPLRAACRATLLKRACARTRTNDVQLHRHQAQSPGWGAASTGANSQPSGKLSGSVPTRGFHVRMPMSTQAAPIPTLHADRLSAPSWQCPPARSTPPRSHIDLQGLVEVCASRGLDCPAWRFRASALDAIIICIASVLTKCLREFATWSQGSSSNFCVGISAQSPAWCLVLHWTLRSPPHASTFPASPRTSGPAHGPPRSTRSAGTSRST
mmetsp:Transcript_93643/g.252488  ORF Transcript_93643/g.252488 Transcript_93643/m.252488 type:complete len:226 (-) Transcript_93643:262-939(-)